MAASVGMVRFVLRMVTTEAAMQEETSAIPASTSPSAEMQRAAEIFRRILVPVDFSDESHRGVFTALELGRHFNSELCFFNLAEFDENDDYRRGLGHPYSTFDLVKITEKRLHDFLENLAEGTSEHVTKLAFVGHDVARWLHDIAREWKATLVLVSTHPRHTLFRSQTEKIMRALNVPVLVLQ
jgi:nucleotide-binding universal stress UspA family protein